MASVGPPASQKAKPGHDLHTVLGSLVKGRPASKEGSVRMSLSLVQMAQLLQCRAFKTSFDDSGHDVKNQGN